MLHGMRPFLLLAAVLVAFHAGPAASAPRCTPQREGEVACLDGKLCECRHDPGGTVAGRRAGGALELRRPAAGLRRRCAGRSRAAARRRAGAAAAAGFRPSLPADGVALIPIPGRRPAG